MLNTAVIVLAGGSSSRLGTPKQLLNYKGSTMLSHVVEEALKVSYHVIVVTGYHTHLISPLMDEYDVYCVENKEWKKGMSTSISAGLHKALAVDPGIDAVIISVCDQPYVSAPLFRQMVQLQKHSGKNIVACAYSNNPGDPVLIMKEYFGKLKSIRGDEGARRIVQQDIEAVALVDFPLGAVDIDTKEDYERYKRLIEDK